MTTAWSQEEPFFCNNPRQAKKGMVNNSLGSINSEFSIFLKAFCIALLLNHRILGGTEVAYRAPAQARLEVGFIPSSMKIIIIYLLKFLSDPQFSVYNILHSL